MLQFYYAKISPYIALSRLNRPIGIWLVMLPCWWGVALASQSYPDPYLLLLFLIGATVMRGAGCTINDLVDRHIDAKVERTRLRPIASGQISSLQAILFFTAQCLCGLWVLLQLPPTSQVFGLIGLLLLFIYPWMKRITYWPQLVLGFAFNIGVFVGWTTVVKVEPVSIWLPICTYIAGIFWTLAYDTIYACQDQKDDILVGVKSTALKFKEKTKFAVTIFYLIFLLLLVQTISSFMLMIPLFLFTGYLVWNLKTDESTNCLKVFKQNQWLGLLVFIALILSKRYLNV